MKHPSSLPQHVEVELWKYLIKEKKKKKSKLDGKIQQIIQWKTTTLQNNELSKNYGTQWLS